MQFHLPDLQPPRRRVRAKLLISVLVTASALWLVAVGIWHSVTAAPRDFLAESTFSVGSGSSMRAIADQAAVQGFVRSKVVLYLILSSNYQPSDLFAGDYYFAEPVDTLTFARTIAGKQIQQNLTRLTFPEGTTKATMARVAGEALPDFDRAEYVRLTTDLEGRLFPDTYFVPDSFTADELVALQLDTFTEKMALLEKQIAAASLTEDEILILASIVEREANDEMSMRTVAGIFLNRLDLGMPLQADASIEYALEIPLGQLPSGQLAEELRSLDSPYNTYLNAGLPPTPIGNPGLQAITAVLEPIESEYYYYLTAPDGTFYYARTLDEHNRNIERYLR